MAGRIPQHFIDELIARADIVEVIGSRVQLKKAGREWKACCPFHGEKTPSFTVSQAKQFYHCFGCGAHGTAIGFLMEHDKLSFVEAVEELASRMGLDVPREGGADEPRQQAGESLYELLGRVALFYADGLREDQRAIDYLKKRGLTGETAAQFRIGYAPDSWNAVLRRFGDNDETRHRLLEAGLTIERPTNNRNEESGFYDRFRDRIMFPIRDARGRVIAFGGRILDKGEPKYLNSPETPVFHKGKEFYGLYEVRQSRQPLKKLLIVEGYMDVVRLHQAGISYAVATLGTATTTEHLERVFRLTPEVIFGFDGDKAGRAAAWRALENALPAAKAGRSIRFLFLPEGHDPDTLVGEEGREAFEARVAKATPFHKYLVQGLIAQLGTLTGNKAKLLAAARPLVEKMTRDAYREETIRELANSAGMAHVSEVLRWIDERPNSQTSDEIQARRRTGIVAAGRGSVARQAIAVLLNFPEVARDLRGHEALAASDNPGFALLSELIQDLKDRPASSKGVAVERWRDRPEHVHLEKLAAAECFVSDRRAALEEVQTALSKMVNELGPARRTEELLAKADTEGLDDQEKLELQGLLKARNARQPTTGKP